MDDPRDEIGMPRWFKVSALVVGLLILVVVVLLFTGHGPGRHILVLPPFDRTVGYVG